MDRIYRTDYNDILNSISPKSTNQQHHHQALPDANSSTGLSTKDALKRLHADVRDEVIECKNEFSRRTIFYWLEMSLSFKSELSKMRWPSVLFMAAQALAHFAVAFGLGVNNSAVAWVGLQGFILLALLIFNLTINLWDTKLRFKELLIKSERLLEVIEACAESDTLLKQWNAYNTRKTKKKDMFAPSSPCVHETLTYRDHACISLPDYLLVRGDVISLFPGDQAPGECVPLVCKTLTSKSLGLWQQRRSTHSQQGTEAVLNEGDIYHVDDFNSSQILHDNQADNSTRADLLTQFEHAKLKRATTGADFLMLSTPYIKSLRLSLQRSHKRPVNSVEKECFIISRKYFETYVIPLVFVLSTIVTAIHYGYLDLTDADHKIKTVSVAYLLMRPSLTIMPFLPWMFPCLWLVVNAYGSARLLSCADAQRRQFRRRSANLRKLGNTGFVATSYKYSNTLATPAGDSSENKHGEEDDLHLMHREMDFKQLMRTFVELILGQSGQVWRSSSLLQVLGSLTSLCFMDKVGILSWPTPSPEKVFLLTENQTANSSPVLGMEVASTPDAAADRLSGASKVSPLTNDHYHHQSYEDNDDDDDDESKFVKLIPGVIVADRGDNQHDAINDHQQLKRASVPSNVRVEVLDLTQTQGVGCFAAGDSGSTGETLAGYTSPQNLSADISLYGGQLQFDDPNWRKFFNSLKPLGLAILMNNCCTDSICDYQKFYKHLVYETLARSTDQLPVIKRRCLCQLARLIGFARDSTNNFDYRNQIGIFKLPEHSSASDPFRKPVNGSKIAASIERKGRLKLPLPNMVCNVFKDSLSGRQQVFSSGTADMLLDACVEFWDGHRLRTLDDAYRKRILDFYHRTSLTSYCAAFSYTPLMHSQKLEGHYVEFPAKNSKLRPQIRRLIKEKHDETAEEVSHLGLHLSNESLEKTSTVCAGDAASDCKSNGKLKRALDELTDQVFVGMVSMQYQACPDFVRLVEQLEHACIRFVHFNRENELRSRVFSEKMGLESGWNCHISLRSDQTDCESSSKRQPVSQKNPSRGRTTSADLEHVDDPSLGSFHSLPSLVMQLASRANWPASMSATNGVQGEGAGSESGDEQDATANITTTTTNDGNSTRDEDFESFAFDMANRAKLPRGIENIRPHLETVDNVPLQVSLFTDCTPELTQEMIKIMQEYGEIVCVIGSSSSKLNNSVFLQANASIAVEPFGMHSCASLAICDDEGNVDEKERSKRMKAVEKRRKKRRERRQKELDEKKLDAPVSAPIAHRPHTNTRDRLGIGGQQQQQVDVAKFAPVPQAAPSSSSSSSSSDLSSHSSSSEEDSCSSLSVSSADMSDSGDEANENDDEFSSESCIDLNRCKRALLVHLPRPSALATILSSFPCSYCYSRAEPVDLHGLIMEARHFTFKMKNTFVCMICFVLSVSSAQFLASILFLPPMFSSGLTIWLTVVVIPMLSFSLMATTMDAQVMKMAVGKNLQLKRENIIFFVLCYLIKFIPSILVVVFNFGLIIAHSCKLTGFGSSSLGPCWMFTYVRHHTNLSSSFQSSTSHLASTQDTSFDDDDDSEELLWSTHLLTAQVCAAFLVVLYLIVISAGFVHRSHLMWQRSPTRNSFWVSASLTLLFTQLVYSALVLRLSQSSTQAAFDFLLSLPLHIWLISFAWPFVVICINLLVKRAEVKATIRQQRRARFDFNTKLGMNSPF